MSMKTILLDGNIYDKLSADEATRTKLGLLVAKGSLRVIATPVVVNELTKSPFGGLPQWFPVELEPEAVGAAGYATGRVAHLGSGESKQVADAIIAHSAHALAHLLVSEDTRCRWRLSQLSTRCKALSYREFKSWLSNAPDS